MNLKKFLVSLLLVTTCFALAAAQTMTVKWQWELTDPDVKAYRYQLDGTKDNAWTVVGGKVDSYQAVDLDPYTDHTLYLQSSYNGVDWSETASSTAKALLTQPIIVNVPDDAIYLADNQEGIVIDELDVIDAESAKATKAKKEKAPKAPKVQSDYPFSFNLLLSAGVGTNVYTDPIKDFKLEGVFMRYDLGFELQNIIHAGPWGMGLRVDANVLVEPYEQTWASFNGAAFKDYFVPANWWFDSSYNAMLMMYFGSPKFEAYLGGGFGYSLFNPPLTPYYQEVYGHSLNSEGKFASSWVVPFNLGFRFACAEHLKLGIELNGRYLLPAKKLTASTDLMFTVNF